MRATIPLLALALAAAADDAAWLKLEPGRELRFLGRLEQTMVRDGQKLRSPGESLQRIFVLAPLADGKAQLAVLTQYPAEQHAPPEVSLHAVDPRAPRPSGVIDWPLPAVTRRELEGGKSWEEPRETPAGTVKLLGRVERKEGKTLVLYALAAPIELQGVKVAKWDEEYLLDVEGGAVLSARVEIVAEEPAGLSTVTSRLEAEPAREVDAAKAKGALEEVRSILDLLSSDPEKAGRTLQGFAERHPGLELEEVAAQLAAFAEAARAEQEGEAAAAAKIVGKPAPDFTLKDLEGKEVSLSDFRGKVVFLSFWGVG
jgi:hypothetical protein